LLDEREEDTAKAVSAGGSSLDWDRVSDTHLRRLLEGAGAELPYPVAAGSVERMPVDEPDPLPGRGMVTWGDLRPLVDELAVLEEMSAVSTSPSTVTEDDH